MGTGFAHGVVVAHASTPTHGVVVAQTSTPTHGVVIIQTSTPTLHGAPTAPDFCNTDFWFDCSTLRKKIDERFFCTCNNIKFRPYFSFSRIPFSILARTSRPSAGNAETTLKSFICFFPRLDKGHILFFCLLFFSIGAFSPPR